MRTCRRGPRVHVDLILVKNLLEPFPLEEHKFEEELKQLNGEVEEALQRLKKFASLPKSNKFAPLPKSNKFIQLYEKCARRNLFLLTLTGGLDDREFDQALSLLVGGRRLGDTLHKQLLQMRTLDKLQEEVLNILASPFQRSMGIGNFLSPHHNTFDSDLSVEYVRNENVERCIRMRVNME